MTTHFARASLLLPLALLSGCAGQSYNHLLTTGGPLFQSDRSMLHENMLVSEPYGSEG